MKNVILLLVLALLASGCQTDTSPRYGMVIGLKQDQVDAYKELHADAWPGVLRRIDRSNIRNFSIWLAEVRPQEHLLFAYFEYDGDDFEADMAAMADDETTLRWWKLTDLMQNPVLTAQPDEHWLMMEEIFYHDKAHPEAVLMPAPKRTGVGKSE
ncbi:MAG: L-rhamnose mutarotase [Rhodospirillales bacterium]|nr:L-rhamnose mutarotase [Rhodospirillales bacterium]